MTARVRWHGIYQAVTTKFDIQDRLDHEDMHRSFERQIKAGVDGLIVCGSLGEASTLSREEKLEILKTAIGAAKGKPVLLTISDGATRDAAKMAEAGAKLGASGLMALPGLPYRSDANETFVHLSTVANAGGLPTMIYNNPVSYGVDITPAALERYADDTRFIAIKESSADITRVSEILRRFGDRFDVFTGVDNLALESFAAGAVGWVAGLGMAYPEETIAVFDLVRRGHLKEAQAIYRWFRPLLDLDVSPKLVQLIKAVESLVYDTSNRCRPPRLALTTDEMKMVKFIVEEAQSSRGQLPMPSARAKELSHGHA